MEFREYALPALEIMGFILLWSLKATMYVISFMVWLGFFALWLVFVVVVFGRLPRSVMRYL
jgi:hypothetical protein